MVTGIVGSSEITGIVKSDPISGVLKSKHSLPNAYLGDPFVQVNATLGPGHFDTALTGLAAFKVTRSAGTGPGFETNALLGFTSSPVPTAKGHMGMDLSSGRLSMFVDGAVRLVAHVDELAAGAGDVSGPAGATDEAVARYDGATGKLLQDSSLLLSDTGILTGGSWQGTKIAETFGGTNQNAYATGDILFASGANILARLAAGTNGRVLTMNGGIPSWELPTGGGDVFGPAGATDNALARYDLATGKLIQNSGAILDNSNNLTGIGNLSVTSIIAGAWNGTAIAATKGGTGQTAYTVGDLLYSNIVNTLTKLPIGSAGQVLTVVGGAPAWAAAGAGAGDVVGPASATDNALARFDTATGKLIQNSVAILTDSGIIKLPNGSAVAPSYSFSHASGMFSPGTNLIAISVGGIELMRVTGSKQILIGTTTLSTTMTTEGLIISATNPGNSDPILEVKATNHTHSFTNTADSDVLWRVGQNVTFETGALFDSFSGQGPVACMFRGFTSAAPHNTTSNPGTGGFGTINFNFFKSSGSSQQALASNEIGLGVLNGNVPRAYFLGDGSLFTEGVFGWFSGTTNDTDTFISRLAADIIGFTTGGSERARIGPGLVVGSPTGGDQGAGTINAVSVFDDGVLLTDWVFDKYYDGHVREEDSEFADRSIWSNANEVEIYTRGNRNLPWMPSRQDWKRQRGSLGGMVTHLWEGQEQQQLQIFELTEQIEQLTNELEKLK